MAYGITPRGTDSLPQGCVQVAGSANPVPVQGGASYTDVLGNASAPFAAAPVDGWKATYALSLLAVTPVATPTDWVTLTWASKVIRITRVELTGIATTAGSIVYQIIKRTTANTGGAFAAVPTLGSYDSANGGVTAVPAQYTANPATLGTGVTIRSGHLALPLAGVVPDRAIIDFGMRPEQALVLRAANQFLAINFNGGALPAGAAIDLTVTFTEE